MMTSTLEVGDLFSALNSHGIERQLRSVAGVDRVSVNPVGKVRLPHVALMGERYCLRSIRGTS
jgi:hypothetical protein